MGGSWEAPQAHGRLGRTKQAVANVQEADNHNVHQARHDDGHGAPAVQKNEETTSETAWGASGHGITIMPLSHKNMSAWEH